jgi:enterochelin esterase family protein
MKHPLRFLARFPLVLALAGILGANGASQQTDLKSHEVHPDGSLTVRYFAPTAAAVTMSLDYDHHDLTMTKDGDGVWSITTGPLAAALHMYGLTVDGVAVLDPLNTGVDVTINYKSNTVWVKGPDKQPWDETGVPHGVVHHHVYRTAAAQGLPDGLEDYYVYTPPGYDASAATPYPVLYLLHGWSALANCWIDDGQANVILDNLIAQGSAKPMVVVMPLGYGDWTFVTGGFGNWSHGENITRNMDLFSKTLLSEILPQVEAGYRVSREPDGRAIAGLSMGGGQSLVIGLGHPDLFGWVGGFSSAVIYPHFDGVIAGMGPKPRLLWVACGTSDDLIAPNRNFVAWLKSKGQEPVAVETPGIHNWPVWRDNLIHFAPLLFR